MLRYCRIPSSGLKISGVDRTDFLMGQMTANLRNLPETARIPALFLNVRGQIEHVAQVYKRSEDYYLHLPEGVAEVLAERFKKYIVFDQVQVENVSDKLATVHVWGDGVAQLLPLNSDTGLLAAGLTVLASNIQRGQSMGIDVHVLAAKLPEMLARWNIPEADEAELNAERIKAGIPDPYRDGFLGYLPQECGMESAVSYNKGCYIGQEIMARLQARGNARYHLVRLAAENIASFSAIMTEGKEVGKTGLSLGTMCLAVLRKDASDITVQGQGILGVEIL